MPSPLMLRHPLAGHALGFGDLVGTGGSHSFPSPTHGQPRYSKAISAVVPTVRRTKSAERHIMFVIMVQSPPQEGVLNYEILNEAFGYRPVPDQFFRFCDPDVRWKSSADRYGAAEWAHPDALSLTRINYPACVGCPVTSMTAAGRWVKVAASHAAAITADASLLMLRHPFAGHAQNNGHTPANLSISGRTWSRSPFIARTGVSLLSLAGEGKAAVLAEKLYLMPSAAMAMIAATSRASTTANLVESAILCASSGGT
jgi:hypothetical protein